MGNRSPFPHPILDKENERCDGGQTRIGIQAELDPLATLRARVAQARDFMDTSLIEEIQKSGYIDRFYGR